MNGKTACCHIIFFCFILIRICCVSATFLLHVLKPEVLKKKTWKCKYRNLQRNSKLGNYLNLEWNRIVIRGSYQNYMVLLYILNLLYLFMMFIMITSIIIILVAIIVNGLRASQWTRNIIFNKKERIKKDLIKSFLIKLGFK